MRRFLKEYFSFSRSEVRILLILSVLIFLSLLMRVFFPDPVFQNYRLTAEDNLAIDEFIRSLEKIRYENKEPVESMSKESFFPVYQNFNPNTVTTEELKEMGFPEFIMKNLLSYRNAGGVFRQKTDLKKLYGVTDSIYSEWENFLVIPMPVEKPDTIKKAIFVIPVIELNNADSAKLLTLNGVGPYFAGKIIKYRDRLGGFLRLEQLLEIKGMDTIRLESLRKHVSIDTLLVKKINLNNSTSKDLSRHPYISYRLAESIMKYKKFGGTIMTTNELIENHIITLEELEKLGPYIKVEN